MKAVATIEDYVLQDIQGWLEKFVNAVRVELHNKNINASGNLSDSFEWKIEKQDGNIHAVVEAASYLIYAEGGRDKGKIPANFTEILEQWIKDKGLSVGPKEDKRFAFLIARKIKSYGSRRKRDGDVADVVGDVLDREREKLNEIIDNRLVIYANDNLFI